MAGTKVIQYFCLQDFSGKVTPLSVLKKMEGTKPHVRDPHGAVLHRISQLILAVIQKLKKVQCTSALTPKKSRSELYLIYQS